MISAARAHAHQGSSTAGRLVHQVAERGPEQPVEADLDRVVRDDGHERPGDGPRGAEPVGEVGVERARVGDEAAHRRVADREQREGHGEDEERQRHSGDAADGERRRHAAAQHGERRGGRHREEDDVHDAEPPAS
jgi:hypothetical protein